MTVPNAMTVSSAPDAADAFGLVGERLPVSSRHDLKLLGRCAAHDPAALRELVERYQRPLNGYLLRVLGSAEDAEEAVQDVFLRAWGQAARFEGRASVATWLYRIATHAAYDILRRRKAQRRAMPPTENAVCSPDAQTQALESLERQERARHLEDALQALRPEDRTLLVLYYQEEMTYDEMCRIMGCAYPVLKVRLMRARRRLRAALEPHMKDVL